MKRKLQAGRLDTGGLLGLRVVVVPDEGDFFAQGFDVDYFASGATEAEAEKNFQDGLEKLTTYHLKKYGNVAQLRQPASEQVKQEYTNVEFSRLESRELPGSAGKHLSSKVVYLLP